MANNQKQNNQDQNLNQNTNQEENRNEQRNNNDEQEFMMAAENARLSSTAQFRSIVAVITTVLLFLAGCMLAFYVLNVLLPVFKLLLGLGAAYLLLISAHFKGFRAAFMDSNMGVVMLFQEFYKGCNAFVESYLGANWLSNLCKHCKK
ncbi:MAG: hypothetical protein FJ161_03620 [Gammaproteobacteria bacterium]|nr:hypothetical protein [Gammaproteobacteria bacterium]